jgi:Thioredoxin like C-terminal domain
LLAEAGHPVEQGQFAHVDAEGAALASLGGTALSPETYVGYERSANFESASGARRDAADAYRLPDTLAVNHWALGGQWLIAAEKATVVAAGGKLVYRFHARDVNLVLGPSKDGRAVRFRVLIDGKAPGDDQGVDIDAMGSGQIREQRLYQLVRQHRGLEDRTIDVEFLDPGAEVYAFTFG